MGNVLAPGTLTLTVAHHGTIGATAYTDAATHWRPDAKPVQ